MRVNYEHRNGRVTITPPFKQYRCEKCGTLLFQYNDGAVLSRSVMQVYDYDNGTINARCGGCGTWYIFDGENAKTGV